MHGRSGDAHSRFGRASLGAQAAKGRQQGRVNVELTPVPLAYEARRMKPHEACVADEVDVRVPQRLRQRGVEWFAAVEAFMINRARFDPRVLSPEEASGVSPIR